MAYKDLREWIARLDRAGELTTISQPVSPYLEMAEIADRAAKMPGSAGKGAGGPALLFENVTGHAGARVLMNQFGSERRMKLALEVDSLDGIAERIRTLLHPPTPTKFLDKLKLLPMLAEVGSFFPKVIDRSRCTVQAGHPEGEGRGPEQAAGADHLAAGWRPVHHVALRHHARSEVGQTQCRDVSHAGV